MVVSLPCSWWSVYPLYGSQCVPLYDSQGVPTTGWLMCAHLWWSMCASFIVVSVCPLHGGQHVPPLSWPVCTPFIFFSVCPLYFGQCVPPLFWPVPFILVSPYLGGTAQVTCHFLLTSRSLWCWNRNAWVGNGFTYHCMYRIEQATDSQSDQFYKLSMFSLYCQSIQAWQRMYFVAAPPKWWYPVQTALPR